MSAAAATPTLEQINAALRPSLSKFLWPWLVGDWLGAILTGCLIILAYRYFSLFTKDRLIYKIVVATVLLSNVGQSVSDLHALYNFAINCFGNDLCLRIAPTSEIVSYAFIILTNATSQIWFAVRAIRMYESLAMKSLLSLVIGSGVLFNLGSGIFSVIKLFQGRNFADADAVAAVFFSNRMAVWGYCGTDAVIALSLVVQLIRTKKSTEFKNTHRLINRLMAYSLGTTALIFTLAAASAGVSELATAENQQFIAIFMIVPRFYALAVLFTLLQRKSSTSSAAILGSSSLNSSSNRSGSPQVSRTNYQRSQFGQGRGNPLTVNVQLETVHVEDKSFDSLDEKYGLPVITRLDASQAV